MIQKTMFEEMRNKDLFDQVITYAFNYADGVRDRPVFPTEQALENLAEFDRSLPAHGEHPGELLSQLDRLGSPATVSQIGGRYFGFVNGGIIPVGLAAKWLNDMWDQNTPLYVTSPVVAKLEAVVESWLNELLDLPRETAAGFVSGSSMAIFCALAAARFRVLERQGWDVNAQGLLNAPEIRVVAGRHAHGTVGKALALLGLGKNSVEWVDVDEQGRIIPDRIPTLDSTTILILQAGNVNSGAFDNFAEILPRARAAGSWVHVDGAFGLWAAGTSSLNHLTSGMELADSWSVDGHKTLNTPYDSGIILCRDREALVTALQASGAYIQYGDNRDGMLYTPEMSRRARAVELWAVLAYLGRSGIDELVTGLHERARQFADELGELEGFQVLNDVVFNQVIVRCETDELTDRTLAGIQELRECWVGGSMWFGHRVIRISVCSWATTEEDVSRSVRSFARAFGMVSSGFKHTYEL